MISMKRFASKILSAGTALLLAVCFAGCAASVNTLENADAGSGKRLLNDRRIVTDSGTLDMATPLEVRTGTTPDGTVMRIQLELMNRTDEIGRVFYLVEWFDEQGMKIEVPSAWKQLNIQPAKIESVTAVAPNAAAKDFRISLKRSE